MKTNLKNFPYASTAEDMESWVRKLERELIEIYTTEYELPDGTKRCLTVIQIDELLGLKKEAQKQ